MEQWIIDRYNKGQDKYILFICIAHERLEIEYHNHTSGNEPIASLYDFLFNPKWGFAKAFWGTKTVCDDCKGKCDPENCTEEEYLTWAGHLQQLVISDNPLEYLEQFKDTP